MSTWQEILEIARFAPSPHNTQPWKIQVVDEYRAALYVDETRTLPTEDTTGCFITCAMGMFIETLSVVAANRAKTLVVIPFPGEPRGDLRPFARLALRPDPNAARRFTDDLVLKRQTSRLTPGPQLVPPSLQEQLRTLAEEHGQQLHYIANRGIIAEVMDQNLKAVVEDLNNRDYHDELVTWFRYNDLEAQNTGDGLSSACMNMPASEMRFLARYPNLARWPVVGGVIRSLYKRRIGNVDQLMMLSGLFWDDDAATQAGRCLMKLWLMMTEHDLYIHPFGNLVTNPTAHAALTSHTGIDGAWIVFRVGYSDPPPRSERLTVEEICVS